MRILLVNTYDGGGAAKACITLHKGLLKKGIQSSVLFLNKNSAEKIEHSYIFSFHKKKSLFNRSYNKIKQMIGSRYHENMQNQIRSFIPEKIEWFSFPHTSIDITKHEAYQNADLINLHWVANFVDYSFFRKNKKPVVWTIHDMNPFTGGCHYADDCNKYLNGCVRCPQLSVCENDRYSDYVFKQKQKYFSHVSNLSIVSPSEWLKNVSASSVLLSSFPHNCIPNGRDSSVYISHQKNIARREVGLPLDKKIILFVSDSLSTRRKGYSILKAAIEMLRQEDILLCSIGSVEKTTNNTHTQIKEFGHIKDERMMSLIYSAVDLFVVPSIEDNLPNTVLESLLCGVPVAGFRVGGISDIIENGQNGYLTESINAASLVECIKKVFSNMNLFDGKKIRDDAIKKYDFNVQADNYTSLFKKILLKN